MTLKIGLIVGREWSFPPAFIDEVRKRDEGVTAEYVKVGSPRMGEAGVATSTTSARAVG